MDMELSHFFFLYFFFSKKIDEDVALIIAIGVLL